MTAQIPSANETFFLEQNPLAAMNLHFLLLAQPSFYNLLAVGQRPRPEAGGRRPVAGGRWPVAGGRRPVAGGRWPVAAGRWPVAGGRWPVAGGRWPVAGGRWPVAGGRRPVAGGRWPVAGGRISKKVYCVDIIALIRVDLESGLLTDCLTDSVA